MITRFNKLYVIPALLAVLMAGCAGPQQNGEAANANSAQPQATSQNGTPASASQGNSQPMQVQTAPPQTASPAPPAAQNASDVGGPAAPRIVVPATKIDFGNQKKEKTLTRTFVIKNEGRAELKIQAVEPS